MTNDDPMHVRQLEAARDAAEIEIKALEDELRRCHEIIAEQQNALNPTHMGEPLIARPKVGAGGTANLCQQVRGAQIEAGENAVIASLRRMGLA